MLPEMRSLEIILVRTRCKGCTTLEVLLMVSSLEGLLSVEVLLLVESVEVLLWVDSVVVLWVELVVVLWVDSVEVVLLIDFVFRVLKNCLALLPFLDGPGLDSTSPDLKSRTREPLRTMSPSGREEPVRAKTKANKNNPWIEEDRM